MQASQASQLPDLDDAAMLASAAQWLPAWLAGVRSKADMQRLDWGAILRVGRLWMWVPAWLCMPVLVPVLVLLFRGNLMPITGRGRGGSGRANGLLESPPGLKNLEGHANNHCAPVALPRRCITCRSDAVLIHLIILNLVNHATPPSPSQSLVGREGAARVEQEAPASLQLPTGTKAAIDYSRDPPTASARLQVRMAEGAERGRVRWACDTLRWCAGGGQHLRCSHLQIGRMWRHALREDQ